MKNGNLTNSKILAKNTIFLYVRTVFSMFVTLFTSRIILKYLGVEDYGIYNAVGGVVAMFSIISSSLSTSISRNLTFELGQGNTVRLNKFFSMAINIQLIIITVVVLLAETIGLWFLNSKMVIPMDRIAAANWIYQFSIVTFSFNLISVPYNACIIAHEKMKTFAYIGILEVVLKLIVVYMLVVSPIDRLVTYGFLLLGVSVLIRSIYQIYCKRHFGECNYHYNFDRDIFQSMFGFAVWNFIGSTSSILRSQGVNVLLNLFFGPIVNAARAVANQVNNAVNTFVGNFMAALTPQITKSYARGDYDYLLLCIYKGSKFSFFLLYFLSLPVLIKTDYILRLWLENVPDTAVNFVRYMLLFSLADTYSRSLINANNATGDIKVYQLVIGGLNLTVLPVAYFILKLGATPESTVLVSIVVSLVGLYPRIYFNRKHIPISYKDFTIQVVLPTIATGAIGYIPPYLISCMLPDTIGALALIVVVCILFSTLTIFMVGCTCEERHYIITFARNKLRK